MIISSTHIGATSCDPHEGVWERLASRNGYGYVEGNPTNWTDPSGLCVATAFACAAAMAFPFDGPVLDTIACTAAARECGIAFAALVAGAVAAVQDPDIVLPGIERKIIPDTTHCPVTITPTPTPTRDLERKDRLPRLPNTPLPTATATPVATATPTVTPVHTATATATPTATPSGNFVRVRHYSANITGIMSSMRLGGVENGAGVLVFVQYPFEQTPRTESELNKKYAEFGLGHRELKGIVEFNLDRNKWIMKKDDFLPEVFDAWQIDLYESGKLQSLEAQINAMRYGISLTEFYDQKGQRLR